MGALSEKELSLITDSLTEEELMIKKFQQLAEQTQDPQIRNRFGEFSRQHQEHFQKLYSLLDQEVTR